MMSTLPPAIKQQFLSFLDGEMAIDLFELWIYAHDELENTLTHDDYLELITLNYNHPDCEYVIRKMLLKYISQSYGEDYIDYYGEPNIN